MSKIITAKEAMTRVSDGHTIMLGGFLMGGSANHLVKALNEVSAKELTLISSDSGTTDMAIYELSKSGRIKKVYASYIGANPETGRMYISKDAEVELVPQGTLIERIRAGGSGLGGFLTPTGVGTIVEEGKEKMTINGIDYLLEMPLKANIALIKANIADEEGNLVIKGSSKNFNTVMATAADYVVVEVDEIVKVGDIDPDHVTVPGIFIDAIVKVGE